MVILLNVHQMKSSLLYRCACVIHEISRNLEICHFPIVSYRSFIFMLSGCTFWSTYINTFRARCYSRLLLMFSSPHFHFHLLFYSLHYYCLSSVLADPSCRRLKRRSPRYVHCCPLSLLLLSTPCIVGIKWTG